MMPKASQLKEAKGERSGLPPNGHARQLLLEDHSAKGETIP